MSEDGRLDGHEEHIEAADRRLADPVRRAEPGIWLDPCGPEGRERFNAGRRDKVVFTGQLLDPRWLRHGTVESDRGYYEARNPSRVVLEEVFEVGHPTSAPDSAAMTVTAVAPSEPPGTACRTPSRMKRPTRWPASTALATMAASTSTCSITSSETNRVNASSSSVRR